MLGDLHAIRGAAVSRTTGVMVSAMGQKEACLDVRSMIERMDPNDAVESLQQADAEVTLAISALIEAHHRLATARDRLQELHIP